MSLANETKKFTIFKINVLNVETGLLYKSTTTIPPTRIMKEMKLNQATLNSLLCKAMMQLPSNS